MDHGLEPITRIFRARFYQTYTVVSCSSAVCYTQLSTWVHSVKHVVTEVNPPSEFFLLAATLTGA